MTFIDLFAGVGGFRRGLELAGHKCLGFCEWDKYATASYLSMHTITTEQREILKKKTKKERQKEILREEYRNGEWYSNDIRSVDGRNIPRADCWCFGAPCQDFSVAGKRAGLEGNRSSLIREVFRILGEISEEERPEWLLYENVKGMFSSNRGFDYLEILLAMDELGYDIEWQLFNSKDWGVPQNRERVYTIGHLRRCGGRKILPITGTNGENCVSVIGRSESYGHDQNGRIYDANGISPCLNGIGNGGNHEPKISVPIDIIAHRDGYRCNTQTFSPDGIVETLDTAQGGGRGHHVALKIINKDCKHMHECVHDINGLASTLLARDYKDAQRIAIPVLTPDRTQKRQNGRRFKENGEPSFTLTTQDIHGVALDVTGEMTVYAIWYPKYECYIAIRKLTPRECFRLQGWTDDYFDKAQFVNSDSQLYKQAGNGVTVNVVYEIGMAIAKGEK